MNKIVECVPNYSVGSNTEIIAKIIAPFQNIPNVSLVNVESDDDYNRTVVTVLGEPEAVCYAMAQSCKQASLHIDMTKHTGEHLRMGATDVIPFIPIRNISIEECVEQAILGGVTFVQIREKNKSNRHKILYSNNLQDNNLNRQIYNEFSNIGVQADSVIALMGTFYNHKKEKLTT